MVLFTGNVNNVYQAHFYIRSLTAKMKNAFVQIIVKVIVCRALAILRSITAKKDALDVIAIQICGILDSEFKQIMLLVSKMNSIESDYFFYGMSFTENNDTFVSSLTNDSFQTNTFVHYFYLLLGNLFIQDVFDE